MNGILNLFLLLVIGCVNAIVVTSNNKGTTDNLKLLLYPPSNIERFSFGHNYSLGDLTWLRTVQDFESCKPLVRSGEPLDNENICSLGWLYQMLETVTNYNPHFYLAYSLGGISLMIIVRDLEGAYKLFSKGVKNFPNDWILRYRLGSHCLLFLDRKEEAAEHFKIAAKNGAPDWLYATAARLLTASGKEEFAQKFYQELKESGVRPSILDRVKSYLEERQ